MAIDQNALLQLLTQLQGSGGSAIAPTSGLQDPSLSGLRLGEQGMGLGGGGSILGGGGGGIGGGEGGPGLDLFQLQALLSAPETRAAGGTLGQFPAQFPTSGAGGFLQPFQGELGAPGPASQSAGQAGMGGGVTAGGILGLLKALTSVGSKIPGLFGTGSLPPDVALAGLGGSGANALPDVLTEAGGATAGALGTGLLGTGGQAELASGLGPDVLTEAGAGGGAAPAIGGGLGGSLPTLPATATGTAAGFAQALSPVGAVLGLMSIADLFGAPNIGIGNIFQSQRINDLNAAQTEAAIQQAVGLARQGGPSELSFAQRGLDAQLISALFPDLGTNFGTNPLEASGLGPQFMDTFQGRGPGLSLTDLTALQAVNPSVFNPASEAQRRYRTLAGFPFVPPPPAIESALDPRAQAFFRDTLIPGDV